MKCAVIGGSSLAPNFTEEQQEKLRGLGSWMAEHDIQLLTGACTGYPYLVVQGFAAAGGVSVGYSPASSQEEDHRVFHHPDDAAGRLVFLPPNSQSPAARLLMRSIPLVDDADAVVSICGNWGTLLEQTAAIVCGKPLIVLEASGGASALLSDIYPVLEGQNVNDYGGQILYAHSISKIVRILSSLQDGAAE